MGACKTEHICQAVPSDTLWNQLILPVSSLLKDCFQCILGLSHISEELWALVTLPVRLGGLGIKDPTWSAAAAHLANMCWIRQELLEFGVPQSETAALMSHAVQGYGRQFNLDITQQPQIVPQACSYNNGLQEKSCPTAASGVGVVRLELVLALSSPHAWVDEPGLSKPLARDEFKCALKWSLGIPLRSESYVCE